MTTGHDEIKYKNLFNKIEEQTAIPGFDDVLNFSVPPKKHAARIVMIGSIFAACVALLLAIYFHKNNSHDSQVSNSETIRFTDGKSLVWQWRSPTQPLLSAALNNNFATFIMPTDHLSQLKISLQINNYKNPNPKK